MRTRAVASLLSLVVALAVAACGSSSSSGGGVLSVSDAWVRAAAGGGTTAAYMTITNGTLSDDSLVGASSPAAMEASVHETTTDASGMTGMQHVDAVVIPAGKTVKLEPGGYHIMLMNLPAALSPGAVVQITLTFEQAGPLNVNAEVRAG